MRDELQPLLEYFYLGKLWSHMIFYGHIFLFIRSHESTTFGPVAIYIGCFSKNY